MRKNYYLKWTAFLMLVTALFGSCNDKLEKYYELGDYLEGSIWEILEKDGGNYSTFLKGIELAGYDVMAKGRSIMTVFAPDNAAFAAYLQSKGYGSIEEMAEAAPDELSVLIGYHLVQYSYTKEMVANQSFSAPLMPGQVQAYMGMFNKFRTFSREPVSMVTGFSSANGQEVTANVFNREKYLPVYSGYLFRSWSLADNAKYNYEYLYPNKELSISALDDFNVANAQVDEYAIPTDNGYIYKISEVLNVPTTLDKELDKPEYANYSQFKKALDRFKTMVYQEDLTVDYGSVQNDSIYSELHSGGIANLASEWVWESLGSVSSAMENRWSAFEMITLFAPTNATLQDFFERYWKLGGYASLDDVNLLAIEKLLMEHQGYMRYVEGQQQYVGTIFPDQIAKTLKLDDETLIDLSSSDVNEAASKMASNGTFYALNEDVLMVPDDFTNALSAVYQDTSFIYFMELVDRALLTDVNKNNITRIFIPDNQMVLATPLVGSSDKALKTGTPIFYVNQFPNIYGGSVLMKESGIEMSLLSQGDGADFVNLHSVTTNVTPLRSETEGTAYRTLGNRSYIYVKDNTVISQRGHNFSAKPIAFTEIGTADNGAKMMKLSYSEDTSLETDNTVSLIRETRSIKIDILNSSDEITNNAVPASISSFKRYVSMVDFNTATLKYAFAPGENMLVFVPKAEVFDAGLGGGQIPPAAPKPANTDPAAEKAAGDYIKRYYMSMTRSATAFNVTYPMPGAGSQGELVSYATYKDADGADQFYHMTLEDTGSELKLTDPTGQVLTVEGFFPYIYTDGAVYVIDGLISLPNE